MGEGRLHRGPANHDLPFPIERREGPTFGLELGGKVEPLDPLRYETPPACPSLGLGFLVEVVVVRPVVGVIRSCGRHGLVSAGSVTGLAGGSVRPVPPGPSPRRRLGPFCLTSVGLGHETVGELSELVWGHVPDRLNMFVAELLGGLAANGVGADRTRPACSFSDPL